MNARHFVTTATDTTFIITEVVKTDILSPGVSRELAWQQARSQAAPVTFVALDGTRRELGDCWDREIWEHAMYTGHISYNLSMTDGSYGPEDKDRWISELRQFPRVSSNDAAPYTKRALARWIAA